MSKTQERRFAEPANQPDTTTVHTTTTAPALSFSPLSTTQPRTFLAQHGDASLWLRYRDADFAIVGISRGMGPRALEQWFQRHGDQVWWPDNDHQPKQDQEEDATVSTRNEKGIKIHVLSPHYRAYLQNLVWIARDKQCSLKKQSTSWFTLTMHAIIQGIPNQHDLASLADKKCHVHVLKSVPSNTAGFLSLVTLTTHSPVTQSKFFRTHMMEAGYPILGKAEGSRSFRGQRLLMSTVRLQVAWENSSTPSSSSSPKQSIILLEDESPASFVALLDKEERFWKQRHLPATDGDDNSANTLQLASTTVPLPRAYQDGHVDFGDMNLVVTPAVMIPRPGSLTLVDCARTLWRLQHPATRQDEDSSPVVILDLGTGSGCLLLALLQSFPLARGYGVDASADALDVARTNARRVLSDRRLDDCCHWVHARFTEASSCACPELANIVVCNPPYHLPGRLLEAATLQHEPAQALFVDNDDDDGLSSYREAWGAVTRLVAPEAIVVMEVCRQNAIAVHEYLHEQGLQQISMARDAKRCIRSIQGIYDPIKRL